MSFYNSTIVLSNSQSTLSINNFAPYILKIDPSQISSTNKVRRIDYIWGDGTQYSQLYKPNPSGGDDPRNHTQTKEFISNNSTLSVYIITINVYTFGSSNPLVFTISLNLQNPKLESNNIFNQFHLVKTRMFGLDNQILYTFETQNSNNLLMSLVNWKIKPSPLVLPQSPSKTQKRPYNIQPPFGLTTIKPNTNIIVDQPVTTPANPDNGSTIIRTYP